MANRIKLDHTDLDHAAFVQRMRELSTALSGEGVFAPLAPKLTPFNALVDALVAKITAVGVAEQGLKQAMTELGTARVSVEEGARGLANASEAETTDAALLQSGGWHLRASTHGPVGPMTAPQNVSCSGGDQDGEVDASFDPVQGRQTYLGQHATSPTGPWTQFYVGKKSSCTASGLVAGQLYYFRFAAVGAAGQGPWSDPASKRAT